MKITCKVCSETKEYKSLQGIENNKDMCLFCRRYPHIKKIDGRYHIPCSKCGKLSRSSKSQHMAVAISKLNSQCYDCSRKPKKDNTLNKLLLLGMKSDGNLYGLPCVVCGITKPSYFLSTLKQNIHKKYTCPDCKNEISRKNNGFVFNNPEEKWSVVPRYEDYSISNFGRLIKNNTFKLLKPQKVGVNGSYRCYTLYNDSDHEWEYAHRLVAQAFIPNPDNLPDINHKNSNTTDNNVDNLEWCTATDNIQHAIKSGRMRGYILNNYQKKKLLNTKKGDGKLKEYSNEWNIPIMALYRYRGKLRNQQLNKGHQ